MAPPQGLLGNSTNPNEEIHEFASIAVIAVVGMIALSIVFSYFSKKYKFYYIPESAFTMILGVLVGGLANLIATPEELKALKFNPELFFFVLLPPIIFEAGYNLKRKRFFRNFGTIVAFAVIGTILSTFVVGFLTYAAAAGGVVEIDASTPLQSLLFGALISAVDPVATLAIMGNPEINCDKMLYSLVFGESVLNDAVAIVLFKTLEGLTVGESRLDSVGDYFAVFGTFLGVSLGSVAVGIAMGLLACLICRYTNLSKYPSKEITLLLLFAYLAYAVAEAIGMSGIMALFFCGIILSHYNWHNLSGETQAASVYVFHAFAHTSETIVFAYVGISIFAGAYKTWNIGFLALAIVFCLIGRAVNIFPISFFANMTRKKPIPYPMQGVIWFAGLRGAIAFALAINMPQPERGPEWNNDVIATTTLGIVMFTTIICGGLTEPILTRMGMKRPAGEDDDLGEIVPASSSSSSSIKRSDTPHRASGFHAWWRGFDQRVMRPCFGGEGVEAHPGASKQGAGAPLVTSSTSLTAAAAGSSSSASAATGILASASDGVDSDAASYQTGDGDIGAGSGSFFGRSDGGVGSTS